MRLIRRVPLVLVAVAAILVGLGHPGRGHSLVAGRALHPGASRPGHPARPRPSCTSRSRAIAEDFKEFGHDLLAAFYNIAVTSGDPELRAHGLEHGPRAGHRVAPHSSHRCRPTRT